MASNSELKGLVEKARDRVDSLQTEEATKTALVMPFIRALGYNVFDPADVVPEFTADIGTKTGEKVDYAIMRNGKPSILFECKHVSNPLDSPSNVSQLYRYFGATDARIGVLTNGIVYKFFSDLDESNKMDEGAFLEVDLFNLDERSIQELTRFAKESFDVEAVVEAAGTLKYVSGMKQALQVQLTEPDDEFVKWIARKVYQRSLTKTARERFTRLAGRAFKEFINDRIDLTLKTAMERDAGDSGDDDEMDGDKAIVTTEQEVEGFMIIKAILRERIDVSRVFLRDTRSYCGVLFDNTNRQPICRLHFNNLERMGLEIFDDERKGVYHHIESLDNIYDHADAIRRRAQLYMESEHQDEEMDNQDDDDEGGLYPYKGVEV